MNPITLKHNSELEPRSTEELLAVFAEFMRIEVADGMATADTIETYHRIVRDWLAWCVKSGVVPIAASRADVIRYRAEMQDSGLSVTSRQQRISIVRRFYDAAIGRGIIKANPADKVRGGRDLTPPEEKIRALTSGALQAVLAQVDTGTLAGKRDLVVLALMAIHGARRVEVQRLDHEHITHEDEPFVTFTGKGMKLRRIYLRADVYRAVREYEAAKVLSGLPGTGALSPPTSLKSLTFVRTSSLKCHSVPGALPKIMASPSFSISRILVIVVDGDRSQPNAVSSGSRRYRLTM